MHFSAILATLLPLTVAMPTILVLHDEVDDFGHDICQRRCSHEKPHCHEGWYPKHYGGCWTCCRHGGDHLLESVVDDMRFLELECEYIL
ncbi:hypothetical protein BJX61DRAFT_355555 [Aspergillus egyptiacus]|nr:hypothetical protein BJX61DRAFT_355555 [Aspergillus egyptiacus]